MTEWKCGGCEKLQKEVDRLEKLCQALLRPNIEHAVHQMQQARDNALERMLEAYVKAGVPLHELVLVERRVEHGIEYRIERHEGRGLQNLEARGVRGGVGPAPDEVGEKAEASEDEAQADSSEVVSALPAVGASAQ